MLKFWMRLCAEAEVLAILVNKFQMRIILTLALLLYGTSVFSQKTDQVSSIKSEYSYQYALIEASRQKMIGNVNEAINLYLSCISANPECDVAYYELGTVYSALGENEKAEDILFKAFKLVPDNYWYGIAYSELLKINNKSSKSLKVLKKVKRNNRSNFLTIDFKIAEIYSIDGRYSKAISVLELIEKEYGVSELISFKKFEIFKLQGSYAKAEGVLNSLIISAPEISEYQIILGEYFAEIGDSVRALQAYMAAFSIDSSNIYAVTNLADIYSSQGDDEKAYFYLNQAFLNHNIPLSNKIQTMMALNKDRNHINHNRKLLEVMVVSLMNEYPDNYEVKTVAYDFYNGIEDHPRALEIIKDILSNKKDDYIIWQQALYNASMLEDFDELIIIGEEALRYFPNKHELYLFVGMAYFQLDNFEKAYSVLSQNYSSIKDSDKIRLQFLIFLSESSYRTDRKTEAYTYFDALVEMDPSNDFTKNNYSYYLALDSVDLLKAKDLSYSTIVNSPDNSTFLDTYSWVLFRLGDYNNAKVFAQRALIIDSEKDPDIMFHYAEILYMLGEYRLAKEYYEKALQKGYNKQHIETKLMLLYEKL